MLDNSLLDVAYLRKKIKINLMLLLDIEVFLLLAATGGIAGLLAGLLGIGGGIIVVPSLVLTFYLLDYSSPYVMHVALGTSLGGMVITSGFSALAHLKKRGVNWHFFKPILPGIILGAVLGAFIADYLPSKQLRIISGVAEILIGLYFLLPHQGQGIEGIHIEHAPLFLLFPIGIGIGAISSILGIGGGIITVPILVAFGVHLRNAISTSAVLGFFIAVLGAITYLALGVGKETLPESIGYVFIPGFLAIGFFSSLTAAYGAKLAYTLPVNLLRRIFAVILILIGIRMLWQ